MMRLPPRSTRADTLFPYTTLFLSRAVALALCCVPIGLAQRRVFPNAIRLGARGDSVEQQRTLARTIARDHVACRSEEHTSELQSLMRTSYAVFCLKNKKHTKSRLHYSSNDTPHTP